MLPNGEDRTVPKSLSEKPRQISNAQLKVAKMPPVDAEWADIDRFALTFDGYAYAGSIERCGEIANSRRHATLSDIRTCLFFEQRRWRHQGDLPDEEAMAYIRDLLIQVRERVGLAEKLLA